MTMARGASWGMLTRVLAVLLAAVLAVQFANFALLQFVPVPRPPLFTVAQVAAALHGGETAPGAFRFKVTGEPEPTRPGRATWLAAALARDLGVSHDAVRLAFTDPPMFRHGPPGGAARPRDAGENRDAVLVGEFSAAFRRADGRWLAVAPVRSGVDVWRIRLLLFLLASLVTVAPFAWLLARWVTRPVAVFANAAERIGRDPHTAPLAVHGPAEIAHAARAMNEMQTRLNRYVDDRTVMIGAIAHDLRTPLMRLALRLEHAPEALRRGVERDVADMQAMIAATTDYVRGATGPSTRRRLELRALAESAVGGLLDRGAQVVLLPGDPVVVEGDPVALRAVLDNLLTNALRYAGDAEVSIARDHGMAIIAVRDHGPGLPDADLDRVFEPFFRSEQSRNKDTGGIGLGLASVRAVVQLHGGTAGICNHPDGGLLAQVELPL